MAAVQGQWAYGPQYRGGAIRRLSSRRLRRRRLWLVGLLVLLAVFVVPWVARASAGHEAAPALVTVQAGDTLWGIAGRYTAAHDDLRPFIDEISRLNHLDGPLQPGQTLVIPGR